MGKGLPTMCLVQDTMMKSGSLSLQVVGKYIYISETAMAPHSSTFAWKIPWTGEPGGLQSMGSLESDTTEAT